MNYDNIELYNVKSGQKFFFVRVKQPILTKLFCTKKQIIDTKIRQNYFNKILKKF